MKMKKNRNEQRKLEFRPNKYNLSLNAPIFK